MNPFVKAVINVIRTCVQPICLNVIKAINMFKVALSKSVDTCTLKSEEFVPDW